MNAPPQLPKQRKGPSCLVMSAIGCGVVGVLAFIAVVALTL